jgi:hypothetical protein
MSRFADQRQAKEFAIGLIASEAERARVPLSELERKMLYFSETGWTVPGMAEAAQRFESEYDSRQYEKKIAALIKKLQTRLKSDDPNTLKAWLDALEKLSEGDHYLLVLARVDAAPPHRPPHDFLKLCVTALLIVVVGVGLMALLPEQAAGPFVREKSAFVMWLIAIIGLSGFLLLALLLGRERANDILDTLISKIFGDPAGKR